ncbi:hypothetical protein FEF65_10055 [Mariprofundus erugo]|uniref:Uncharacterized protein n=2 Tax=Mariprofundus erugo TaxID=2528639 RepID=A0A5R9GK57_9PROT|nr:hypothetical protein FEF65_10055 [Mariprofundus erugo]
MNGLKPCGAHARTTGKPCRQPAMANGRCRLHGGKSTGRPVTSWLWTKEAKEIREEARQLIKEVKELNAMLK